MKKRLVGILTALVFMTLVSCNGGSSRTGDVIPTEGFENASLQVLAEQFAKEINGSDLKFKYTLVKSDTLREDYAVFECSGKCSGLGRYRAINLKNYVPGTIYDEYRSDGTSARSHLRSTNSKHLNFFDLDYVGDGVYQDYSTGALFEKTQGSSKDLAKLAAIKEDYKVAAQAKNLSSRFGLSKQRGIEIAKLNSHWKKASKKSMTRAEIDGYSTELLGFSMSKGIEAFNEAIEGNADKLDNLLDKASDKNGITPEHAEKIMVKMFNL